MTTRQATKSRMIYKTETAILHYFSVSDLKTYCLSIVIDAAKDGNAASLSISGALPGRALAGLLLCVDDCI